MPDNPIAHALPDGRVAVYIAAGYRHLSIESARSLQFQLGIAIEQAAAIKPATSSEDSTC